MNAQTGINRATEMAARSTLSERRAIKLPNRSLVIIIAASFIIASVIGAYFYFTRSHRARINSIAILPFASASNDPNTEYLSDGITESLINSLSEVPNLRMIARNSVFRYKGKEVDPQVVGRELGVQAILMGHITQLGDNLSISAELVDARDNSHLWGEQYTRKLSDILQLQEEISRGISENLRLKLTGEEKQRLAKRYTGNTEAYQLYLQGRYYLNNFENLEEAHKAINYFERAIAVDPNYALAYAGLADAYILLGEPFNVGLPPKEALRKAKAAATKALEMDDTLGEARVSLAHVIELHEWDWSRAEAEYKRAIELNPNNATARRRYSVFLQEMGRHTEAMAEIKRAAELDPLNDLIMANIGFVFYTAREYDQAIKQFQRVEQHIGLGWAYEEKEMYEEAIAEFQKESRLREVGDLATASLGHAYATSGRKAEAQKLLDELKGRSKQRYVSPYLIAKVYIGLGEKDQAFAWLEKGYDNRDQWMIWLKSDPQMDSLRGDQRFVDLMRHVGLPQ